MLSSILFLMYTRKISLALHLSEMMQDHPFSCPLCCWTINLELQKAVQYWRALRWAGKLSVMGFLSLAKRFIAEAISPWGPSEISCLKCIYKRGLAKPECIAEQLQLTRADRECLFAFSDLSLACFHACSWGTRAPRLPRLCRGKAGVWCSNWNPGWVRRLFPSDGQACSWSISSCHPVPTNVQASSGIRSSLLALVRGLATTHSRGAVF